MGLNRQLANLPDAITTDTSNNVGIGGSPSGTYKFEVTGTSYHSAASTFGSTATATAFIPSGATIPTNGMYLSAANTLNFSTNSTKRITFGSGGKVEISSSVAADVLFNIVNSSSTGSGLNISAGSGSGTYALRVENYNGASSLLYVRGDGNVGIGTTSPNDLLELKTTSASQGNLRLYNTFNNGASNYGIYWFRDYDSATNSLACSINYSREGGSGGYLSFNTGTVGSISERMRITSGGQLYFNRTSTSGSTDVINIEAGYSFSGRGILLNMDAGNDAITVGGSGSQNALNVTNSNKKVIISNLGGSGTVTVQADNSGTLIKSSDSSLKQEDTNHIIEGLAQILQLQPRAYKWLKDIEIRKEEAVTEIGFFADEVNPIIPSAAPKGFDGLYGFNDRAVTAALVKGMQEQQAQIEELKKIVSTK